VQDNLLVPKMRPHAVSIFAAMSRLASETDSINLGQGFPDTDGPQELKDEAIACINSGMGNQYPPPHGFLELRAAISAHQKRFYDLDIDPDTDVVATTGASEAIAASLLALVETGDEVVFFDPAFDVYRAVIDLSGAKPIGVPLGKPDLRPDVQALAEAITPATKVLLLNSPHNPSGIVFNLEELSAIAELAIAHDLIVVSDEAYEHLWFDSNVHIPISTLPGMFNRTITIGSGGKCFSFTGWKVGWASGPRPLISAVKAVRQHLSYVSGGPFQLAIAKGLGLPDQYFTEFRRDLSVKRDQLSAGLAEIGMRVIPTEGTYFVTTDISPLGFTDGLEFVHMLANKCKVVAIPHQVFTDSGQDFTEYVRWAFCKKPEVLAEATERIRTIS
jgi:N-succinyldiaminopimelate aminotransferase